MLQAPELAGVVKQYMAQKAQKAQQAEVESQAQKNVLRKDIQTQVEDQSGFEDRKILDQIEESTKRKLMTPKVEDQMGYVPPPPTGAPHA